LAVAVLAVAGLAEFQSAQTVVVVLVVSALVHQL
jgi:hypothetical protein